MREHDLPTDTELVRRVQLIQENPEEYYRENPRIRFGFHGKHSSVQPEDHQG
ncbi:hypothetical protein [Corynebacterium amycolatum]|uniref:hypothetical protein n=1 Tax=Corynebacterium amycolatum TaxID=43765 RepID=UPI001CCA56B9|nr:hypothetical protein [Corynebacterium amycolatum]MCA0444284.1 hypothetical protein [Corynebacterium amycolatum]